VLSLSHQAFQILSGILNLGNCEFFSKEDEEDRGIDAFRAGRIVQSTVDGLLKE